MTEFARMVVPVDFSSASVEALDYAILLGGQLGSTLFLIHAYELPNPMSPVGAAFTDPQIHRRIVADANERMARLMEERSGKGVDLECRVAEGQPWSAILDLAKEVGANLIVMGTAGRTGLPRLLLGSVAEKVVRTSEIPVLTIRPVKDSRPPPPRE